MADLIGAGSAGLGRFRVNRETGEVRYDPLAAEGWPAGAVAETRLDVLVRDAAGRLALGQVSVDVTRPSGAFDRLDLPGLMAVYDTQVAASVTVGPGGNLSVLADLSAAGADAVPTAGNRRPNFVSISGFAQPLASFGTYATAARTLDTPLRFTGPGVAAGFSLAFVVRLASTSETYGYLIDESPGDAGFGVRVQDGHLRCFVRSAATGTTPWGPYATGGLPLPTGQLCMIQADLRPGIGLRMRVNGGVWGEWAYPQHNYVLNAGAGAVATIGNDLEGRWPLQGVFGEFLAAAPALSDANSDAYAADAMSRWGIVA